jgi:hypothetical protein
MMMMQGIDSGATHRVIWRPKNSKGVTGIASSLVVVRFKN